MLNLDGTLELVHVLKKKKMSLPGPYPQNLQSGVGLNILYMSSPSVSDVQPHLEIIESRISV